MVNKAIPIMVGTKVVGSVKGRIFYKTVKGSIHFLRVPPAISNDVDVLTRATQAGADTIIVKDMETGQRYMSNLADLQKFGFPIDRGFGNQIALPMKRWTIIPPRAKKP